MPAPQLGQPPSCPRPCPEPTPAPGFPFPRSEIFPLIYTARLSLHKWTLTGGDKGFVGLDNYRRLFADDQFWNAMFNTFGLFVVGLVMASGAGHQWG